LRNFRSGAVDWIQVWVADGNSLKPLEAQILEGGAASAAAFSPDGTQLAINSADQTVIWQVRPNGVKQLGKAPASGATDFAFSADNRWLAMLAPSETKVYDCDQVQPGGGGQRFRQDLLWASLAFVIAASALLLVQVGRITHLRKFRLCRLCGGTGIYQESVQPNLGGKTCSSCDGRGRIRSKPGALMPEVPLARRAGLLIGALMAEVRLARGTGLVTGAMVLLGLGGIITLMWSSVLAVFGAPTLQTPPGSPLAQTTAMAITFSPDGRSLAAVFPSGDLAAFDTKTGAQTGKWSMPEKVTRVEYAPGGRHLLAIADRKAYVLRLRAFDEAGYILACCEAELKDDPGSVDALMARGLAYREKGDLPRAIADLTKAIDRDGSNASAYYQRGLARADSGDLAGSRADLADAVGLDPLLDPNVKPAAAPKKCNGKQR
jgi:hypothetical protein